MPQQHDGRWWREAVFYQVYPRSFCDTNGDGIGDLQGIVERLDYLNDGTERSLGIDAIWLSPTFPSPMKDFGYDVSDYCDVHPDFGTLTDMDRLIAECHRRGIRVLLDYVPNHTSDQHPWFKESRSSRNSPKRDWYIWRDAKRGGSLPNNWRSVFGGPAWTFDEHTGQYYLHSFLAEQPDLNWRNPEVVRAMHGVLRFWMERGVDGFRIDVMGMIVKHPRLANNPVNPRWRVGLEGVPKYVWRNNRNYPDVFLAVKGIRRVLDEFPGRMAVGEVFGTPGEIANFYGNEALDGLHLAFNFHLINQFEPASTRWEAATLRHIVGEAEATLPRGAQPCYVLGNHDRPRFISRHNHDGRGAERARAAAILLLGLRNSPFLYYGEEIGMVDGEIPEERLQDPARFHYFGRDPERIPMQWDATPGRGFSVVEPWLPYGPIEISVATQDADPDSLLSLYRRAIWRRKAEPALIWGNYEELAAPEGAMAFARRTSGERTVIVAINTETASQALALPSGEWSVLLCGDRALEGRPAESPFEIPPLGGAWLAQA